MQMSTLNEDNVPGDLMGRPAENNFLRARVRMGQAGIGLDQAVPTRLPQLP
jgi:hypothetical protein